VARNRKRAKERRARRPQPVASNRPEPDETPGPIAHATPDVELAEAQLAIGRPELPEPEEPGDEDFEPDELDADGRDGGGGGYDDEGPPSGGGGGDLVPAGGAVPEPRPRAGNRLIGFLQGSWRELQRVQWPDRRQVAQATGVVLGFVIIAGAFLGVSDLVAQKLVNFILK
jgi:preprotein translocase subunit SecE